MVQSTIQATTLNLTAQAGSLDEVSSGAVQVGALNATASGYVDLVGSGNMIGAVGTDQAGPGQANKISGQGVTPRQGGRSARHAVDAPVRLS